MAQPNERSPRRRWSLLHQAESVLVNDYRFPAYQQSTSTLSAWCSSSNLLPDRFPHSTVPSVHHTRAVGLSIVVAVVGAVHGKEGERIVKSAVHLMRASWKSPDLSLLPVPAALLPEAPPRCQGLFSTVPAGPVPYRCQAEARIFVGDGKEAFSIRVTGLCQKLFALSGSKPIGSSSASSAQSLPLAEDFRCFATKKSLAS